MSARPPCGAVLARVAITVPAVGARAFCGVLVAGNRWRARFADRPDGSAPCHTHRLTRVP